MATTIITKNGSGAPAAGDLVQGELAVDLTNQTLYSKDSSGNVFKVGDTGGGSSGTFTDLVATDSFTSPGIDDNATSTAITIDANENVGIGTSDPVITNNYGGLTLNGASGGALSFTDDDVLVGNLLSSGSDMYFGTGGDTVFRNGGYTGSDEAMRIDATGNVGINASNPSEKLHVGGNALVGGEVESVASGATAGFKWGQDTATNYWKWAEFNNGSASLQNNSTSSAGSVMTIDTSGNVGIGNTNPTRDLDVGDGTSPANVGIRASSSPNILFTSGGANVGYIGTTLWNTGAGSDTELSVRSENDLTFTTGSSERMRIDDSGRVGIGNSSPSSYTGAGAPSLVIGDHTGFEGVTLASSTSGTGNIAFADSASGSEQYRGLLRYDHAEDSMQLWTASVRRMTIDSTGNVGIGTDAPDSILHVNKSSASCSSIFSSGSGGVFLSMQGANGTHQIQYGANASSPTFAFYDAAASATRMTLDESGRMALGGHAAYNRLDIQGAPTSSLASTESQLALRNTNPNRATYFTFDQTGDLTVYNTGGGGTGGNTVFHQTSGEAMRIDATGNVGIGTSDPQQALHVAGGGLQIEGNISAPAAGTESALIDYFNNNMRFWSRGTSSTRGTFEFVQVENDGQNQQSPMVIDASGNLLVGTTAPIGAGASGVTVADISSAIGQVSIGKTYSGTTGAMKFYYGSTEVGRIDYSDTTTTYITSSDERLKENVVDAPAGNIDALQVRSFDWKIDGEHQEYGFIAQELETVAPYAVSKGETDEDMWGVDYSKLVPMLVKEIQDLKAEVAALKGA
jgi:hypothetical protein